MIVVVGGVKGGSGKTTIATNLTVLRSQNGKKVLLVDADEQKSSFTFASQRDATGIETNWTTIQLAGQNLHSQILRIQNDYDDIIIDVGGRDTRSQRSALLVADIYLIPFNPASYDIWTLSEVKNIIRDMKCANSKFKVIALINRADSKGYDNDDALNILSECQDIECLKHTIGNRKSFRSSSSDGLSVIEMKNQDKKAIQEITEIYNYLYK